MDVSGHANDPDRHAAYMYWTMVSACRTELQVGARATTTMSSLCYDLRIVYESDDPQ